MAFRIGRSCRQVPAELEISYCTVLRIRAGSVDTLRSNAIVTQDGIQGEALETDILAKRNLQRCTAC